MLKEFKGSEVNTSMLKVFYNEIASLSFLKLDTQLKKNTLINLDNYISEQCGMPSANFVYEDNYDNVEKDDLYIGYPYVQGRFNKDKVVRAPLVLHKITIREAGDNVYVSNVGIRLLNPVFVMSYLVENDLKYKDHLDFEIAENDLVEAYRIYYRFKKTLIRDWHYTRSREPEWLKLQAN